MAQKNNFMNEFIHRYNNLAYNRQHELPIFEERFRQNYYPSINGNEFHYTQNTLTNDILNEKLNWALDEYDWLSAVNEGELPYVDRAEYNEIGENGVTKKIKKHRKNLANTAAKVIQKGWQKKVEKMLRPPGAPGSGKEGGKLYKQLKKKFNKKKEGGRRKKKTRKKKRKKRGGRPFAGEVTEDTARFWRERMEREEREREAVLERSRRQRERLREERERRERASIMSRAGQLFPNRNFTLQEAKNAVETHNIHNRIMYNVIPEATEVQNAVEIDGGKIRTMMASKAEPILTGIPMATVVGTRVRVGGKNKTKKKKKKKYKKTQRKR